MLHDFYISSANLFEILPFWTANISVDFQWNKMNSDIKEFIYPQRWSGWAAAATSFDLHRLKIQASLLTTLIHETTREDKKDIQRDWRKLTPTVMCIQQPFLGCLKHQFPCFPLYAKVPVALPWRQAHKE